MGSDELCIRERVRVLCAKKELRVLPQLKGNLRQKREIVPELSSRARGLCTFVTCR